MGLVMLRSNIVGAVDANSRIYPILLISLIRLFFFVAERLNLFKTICLYLIYADAQLNVRGLKV